MNASSEEQLTPGSIFDDRDLLGPEEGTNLKVRARLLDRLIDYVEKEGFTQEEAAAQLGVGQPRISNLLKGKISKFTIDALLNMCAAAGIEVEISFPDGTRAAA
jgi:predicted XRE-type DNA-binding protein